MNKKGFSLVELMIVILVIIILGTIAVTSYKNVQMNARDSTRIHDFKNMQEMLEVYYAKYGVYPCGHSDSLELGSDCGTEGSTISCPADPITDLPGFLNGVDTGGGAPADCVNGPLTGLFHEQLTSSNCPKDPLNLPFDFFSTNYIYKYQVPRDRQSYVLGTYLERNDDLMHTDGGCSDDVYEVGPGVGTITIDKSVGLRGDNWTLAPIACTAANDPC